MSATPKQTRAAVVNSVRTAFQRDQRASSNRFPKVVRAISADHLDLRMGAPPGDDLLRLNGGQQVHYTSRRQIDDDGSKTPTTAKGELVDPNCRADDRRVQRHGSDCTQQR